MLKQKTEPWHQVLTHMRRLSLASKGSSSKTICPKKAAITATGESLLFPDNSTSDTISVHPVFLRPDMVG